VQKKKKGNTPITAMEVGGCNHEFLSAAVTAAIPNLDAQQAMGESFRALVPGRGLQPAISVADPVAAAAAVGEMKAAAAVAVAATAENASGKVGKAADTVLTPQNARTPAARIIIAGPTPVIDPSTVKLDADARCAFSDRNLQPRMPLVLTPLLRLKLLQACDQWHSSREFTQHFKVRPNAVGCSLILPVSTVNCVQTLKAVAKVAWTYKWWPCTANHELCHLNDDVT
jgi:hypothetical protein